MILKIICCFIINVSHILTNKNSYNIKSILMKKLLFLLLFFSQITYGQEPPGMPNIPGMPGEKTEGFTRNGYVKYKCKAVNISPKSSGTIALGKLGAGSGAYYDYSEEKLYVAPGASVNVSVDDFQTMYNDFLSGTAPPPTQGVSQVPALCGSGTQNCNYNWANETASYKIYLQGGGYLSTYSMGPNVQNNDNGRKVSNYTRENVWNLVVCGGNPAQ